MDCQAIWDRVYPKKPLTIYDDDPKYGLFPPSNLRGTVIYGVNDPHRRYHASSQHSNRGAKALIDPSAVIGPNVVLGRGVVVAPGAVLLRDVILGEHVHCNYLSSMTRCHIKSFSTLSPGAVVCGDVTIGQRTLIGANATVCDRVKIGNDVIVAAGAIVPPLSIVPDGSRVIGVWKQ